MLLPRKCIRWAMSPMTQACTRSHNNRTFSLTSTKERAGQHVLGQRARACKARRTWAKSITCCVHCYRSPPVARRQTPHAVGVQDHQRSWTAIRVGGVERRGAGAVFRWARQLRQRDPRRRRRDLLQPRPQGLCARKVRRRRRRCACRCHHILRARMRAAAAAVAATATAHHCCRGCRHRRRVQQPPCNAHPVIAAVAP